MIFTFCIQFTLIINDEFFFNFTFGIFLTFFRFQIFIVIILKNFLFSCLAISDKFFHFRKFKHIPFLLLNIQLLTIIFLILIHQVQYSKLLLFIQIIVIQHLNLQNYFQNLFNFHFFPIIINSQHFYSFKFQLIYFFFFIHLLVLLFSLFSLLIN